MLSSLSLSTRANQPRADGPAASDRADRPPRVARGASGRSGSRQSATTGVPGTNQSSPLEHPRRDRLRNDPENETKKRRGDATREPRRLLSRAAIPSDTSPDAFYLSRFEIDYQRRSREIGARRAFVARPNDPVELARSSLPIKIWSDSERRERNTGEITVLAEFTEFIRVIRIFV